MHIFSGPHVQTSLVLCRASVVQAELPEGQQLWLSKNGPRLVGTTAVDKFIPHWQRYNLEKRHFCIGTDAV